MTLRAELLHLINRSHSVTWARFDQVKSNPAGFGLSPAALRRWTTPGEPAFVSGLLGYWASVRLGRIIKKHLSPALVMGDPLVSGVFMHQKPYVEYGTPSRRVEIADLLLVRHHFTLGEAEPQGRAVLIQAKRSKRPGTGTLRGKDAEQFDLYSDWNRDLTFPNGEPGQPPSGKYWNLSHGVGLPKESGRYGVVAAARPGLGPAFPEACAWAASDALPSIIGSRRRVNCASSMAALFEDLLQGVGGRRWCSNASPHDHWSAFVERMIIQAAGVTYPLLTMGAARLPRMRGCLLPVLAHFQHSVRPSSGDWPEEVDFEDIMTRYRASKSFGEHVSRWMASLAQTGEVGGKGGGDDFDAQPLKAEPGSGMSVLYVATIGEVKMEDRQSENY